MIDRFTIIDGPTVSDVRAAVDDDRVVVPATDVEAALGWTLKPEGLCQGDVCIPRALTPDLVVGDDGIDLDQLGRALGRPLVVDRAERLAALGAAADERAATLATLDAPPLSGLSLDGEQIELADLRGRKKLLVAFASW